MLQVPPESMGTLLFVCLFNKMQMTMHDRRVCVCVCVCACARACACVCGGDYHTLHTSSILLRHKGTLCD